MSLGNGQNTDQYWLKQEKAENYTTPTNNTDISNYQNRNINTNKTTLYNKINILTGGIVFIIFIILIYLSGLIFPVMYIYSTEIELVWLQNICIIYSILYAIFSILNGKFILYIGSYIICLIFILIYGYSSPFILALVEVPFINTCFTIIHDIKDIISTKHKNLNK